MRLRRLSAALERRLFAIDEAADNSLLGARHIQRRERWAIQEGLISQKWQAWCGFCRSVLIHSALGAETDGGTMTNSPNSARTERELAWIAKQAARNQAYANVQSIAGSHLEPTWGDPGKIALMSVALGMSNEAQLSSGLLSASQEARHLQVVRNATAHISKDNISEAVKLNTVYRAGVFESPSDVMLWEEPISGDFAYRYWSDRLIIAANLAIL